MKKKPYKVFSITLQDNNAIGKNKILSKARAEGLEYIFIIQNDLEVDKIVYEKYIELMKGYNLPCAFYSFYKSCNRLFTGSPNPIAKIKVTEDENICVVRKAIDTFICLNMSMYGIQRFIHHPYIFP